MGTLQLEVVTPDKTVVSAEVEMAVCPGVEGEFGVLPQHVSMLSALKIGDLRYRVNGKDENVFISGGFADVNNNVLSVLAESAELATDIDTARAQAAKERAEKRLSAHDDSLDETRAEAALQRAVTRLQVAQLR
ncbi:ATP synthase F1, epsilon subunit [Desulfovibrio sp. 6_1_46AFAA]|uniref:ATP synthase epsilon chain n=1 Tax=Desulfovibrio fairfieldensis TaxID=44742 RepID=A0A0X8JMS2_9BACT|nr:MULTISPECIES: F0F1 ATP synthase subunit epsilon [Desulfovibrio]GKG93732.1 ATP synthase epsilon chain [Desulfovibrionaceae bacterium]AMD91258.1 ATP synthase F0F1 subunit epsilon [Desulfovibrio fairfieldensis]EFL86753.2 ATP synthase F1, epsilon subunit [Desulfovibrio sp. 3_1_syn3]EGW50764.1 ATP synthase F1, epsilon subunit [Desulfovibrio sp. 6_1_46AFAA]GKI12284.1 ATP synthase epsilon chain [Desulfovibrionaceae bacterium]